MSLMTPISLDAPLLVEGDAVRVLRERFAERSVDMVYADPPFGNEQLWTGKAGAFSDRWAPDAASAAGWAALRAHDHRGCGMMQAAAGSLGRAAQAYLGMMAGLVVELHRVLKLTGTLWLHFDDTMGAYLRLLCDAVFGPGQALGTVVWRRTAGSRSTARSYGRVHDTIACYARSRAARWRLWRCAGEFTVGDPCDRLCIDGYADDALNAASSERVGYPTQKPVALIERFIRAATLPGGVVLDPTCGSGTTVVAARRLDRHAIGIDRSPDAIAAALARVAAERPKQIDIFGAIAAAAPPRPPRRRAILVADTVAVVGEATPDLLARFREPA